MNEEKKYRVLFDNGGIPMWMSFKTRDEADMFAKDFKVLKREFPKEVKV